ncbi:hypothetical protein HDU96_006021 [Phlyctochytrium bullatum]|nr:hypothetical protein HDU96_006021 [Phlyctochytrium bullatum]
MTSNTSLSSAILANCPITCGVILATGGAGAGADGDALFDFAATAFRCNGAAGREGTELDGEMGLDDEIEGDTPEDATPGPRFVGIEESEAADARLRGVTEPKEGGVKLGSVSVDDTYRELALLAFVDMPDFVCNALFGVGKDAVVEEEDVDGAALETLLRLSSREAIVELPSPSKAFNPVPCPSAPGPLKPGISEEDGAARTSCTSEDVSGIDSADRTFEVPKPDAPVAPPNPDMAEVLPAGGLEENRLDAATAAADMRGAAPRGEGSAPKALPADPPSDEKIERPDPFATLELDPIPSPMVPEPFKDAAG